MKKDLESHRRIRKFKKFNSKNLAYAIWKAFPYISPNLEQLQQELQKFVFPRLDFMAEAESDSLYFMFEERYVETEWKDMISLHYINTSYEVRNTVMRVHLFAKNKMQEKYYKGCFTLRTIDETQIMLAYIYPNWKLLNYKDKLLSVMTYKKRVHINGQEIVFHTYPLFVQDHAVVSCAQACLVAMSKYLHSLYDYNRIQIGSINDSYHSKKTKIYPTQGLYPTQMLEVLYNHDIPCGYEVYNDPVEFKEYVDYCIESAIPVLIGIHIKERVENGDTKDKRHVIQIIGHSNSINEKEYVIYDDSGYYLRNIGKNGFVRVVSWDVLSMSLEQDKSFIIYPIHEKVYFLYKNFRKHLDDMTDESEPRRILLIDNKEVKQFLKNYIVDDSDAHSDVREEATRLLQIDMPHYLWCCEYSVTKSFALYLADPTYNRRTTKSIFLNRIPLMCKSHIGLLKYD